MTEVRTLFTESANMNSCLGEVWGFCSAVQITGYHVFWLVVDSVSHLWQESGTASSLQQSVVTQLQVQILVLVLVLVSVGLWENTWTAQNQRHKNQDGGTTNALHTCRNIRWEKKNIYAEENQNDRNKVGKTEEEEMRKKKEWKTEVLTVCWSGDFCRSWCWFWFWTCLWFWSSGCCTFEAQCSSSCKSHDAMCVIDSWRGARRWRNADIQVKQTSISPYWL